MDDNFAIQLFEGKRVRIVWEADQEKYYFSVVDIVQVLTDSADYQTARKYWKVLKGRLKKEGNESVTNCYQLKLPSSDGKKYKTDMADLQGIFRLIQSVPSKKAEPIKQWLAQLGEQRIDQIIDPELTFQMAVEDYRRQGYSEKWINERMRSIEMRKELTDEELAAKLRLDSIDKLREMLKGGMQAEAEGKRREAVREAVYEKISAAVGEFELPAGLLEAETSEALQRKAQQRIGGGLEKVCQRHQRVQIGCTCTALPFGNSPHRHIHSLSQLLLGQIHFFAVIFNILR